MKQRFELTSVARALGARQFVHLGSDDATGAGLRLQPLPGFKVRFKPWVPRVDEQQYRSCTRTIEVRLDQPVELLRGRLAPARVSVPGQVDQIERRRRSPLHAVKVGQTRFPRS